MKVQSFGFYIAKCQNEPKCKTDSEINEFIRDIDVNGWNIHNEIDFGIYDQKPTYKVMDIWGQWLLNHNVFIDEYQQFQQHDIHTEDDLFAIDSTTFEGTYYNQELLVKNTRLPDSSLSAGKLL